MRGSVRPAPRPRAAPAAVSIHELFDAYTDEQLARTGQVHGLVVLEVFGHTDFIGPLQEEVFRSCLHNVLADMRRRIPAAGGPGTAQVSPAPIRRATTAGGAGPASGLGGVLPS